MEKASKAIPRTLDDISALQTDFLTCRQVSGILHADPYTIHMQATDRPELLGFPVIVMKRRVKIPRLAFVAFMKGKYNV